MKIINLWGEMMPQSREQCMVTWVFVMVKVMEYYSKKIIGGDAAACTNGSQRGWSAA